MAQIHILDSETIDKIAAGEVVERPASVVKELVENALDAGASAITVEIRGGGIEFIRVTDNGCGMERDQLRNAFLRHATSKIQSAEDLQRIVSLGFRGEALSSISAVSKVEVITKPADNLIGTKILIEGGREISFEEVGAPDGTTFVMRNLFYNTPVRRKFLKQPPSEGGAIADLCQHLALSRPDVSFQLIQDNKSRFHTSGNGDLKEVIYRIFGRETARELVSIHAVSDAFTIRGYLGKPSLVRPNRSQEIYFINGRFIRSSIIAKAAEEGYKEYLMQHKFPFLVLHITMDTSVVDVNVHPTKMDVRFTDPKTFYFFLRDSVSNALRQREMIPTASLFTAKERQAEGLSADKPQEKKVPEVFEQQRARQYRVEEESAYRAERLSSEIAPFTPYAKPVENPLVSKVLGADKALYREKEPSPKVTEDFVFEETSELQVPKGVSAECNGSKDTISVPMAPAPCENTSLEQEEDASLEQRLSDLPSPDVTPSEMIDQAATIVSSSQLNLFEDKILTADNRKQFRLIGQVFDTYWMIEYEDKLLLVDQHAAHEKVNYERLMRNYRDKTIVSQQLMPPIIVTILGQEASILSEHKAVFEALGFEVEPFGGNEYALRAVPAELYGCDERSMFLYVLDSLSEGSGLGNIRVIEEKIASMACKASIKGNQSISRAEAELLIDELLTLDNPYNCPHGRPTIVVITKSEMEKKFKRIV